MRFSAGVAVLGLIVPLSVSGPSPVEAQDPETSRVIGLEMSPVRRAQIAVWIENPDETFLRTLALTQSVAVYGIGNRPGASQMNSGFNWPYGRREGVLPVWAHRRAGAPSAEQFRRVIFQDRTSEGWASRSSNDYSVDNHFCLSFNQEISSRDSLDAMTCPSRFSSDKGRYLSDYDMLNGYSEPFQTSPGSAMMRPLDIVSLYPPRRDAVRCTGAACYDHADVDLYVDDVRRIMPEIDAVTIATPPEGTLQRVSFTLPDAWPNGDYVLFVEVNTEGDYNDNWGPSQYPTPTNPSGAWDFWAMEYGYPFRGQPSVVFRLELTVGNGLTESETLSPWGYGSIDGQEDVVHEMDASITNSPGGQRGSGVDRLFVQPGEWRVRANAIGAEICEDNVAPGGITNLLVQEFADRRAAHRYATLSFAAAGDDIGVAHYDVRFATVPITDDDSFMRALPAQAATLEHEALVVPTDLEEGVAIQVDMGGMSAETTYYIAVRAVDRCNLTGPISSTEFQTLPIEFTTVSPCFIATAAYGTPLADDIGTLRRFRDRHLETNAPGRLAVDFYETVGPVLAGVIREDESLRSATRAALRPIVAVAEWLN